MKTNNLLELQEKINYTFKDQNLLTTSLTHRSCLNNPKTTDSYERLEFLGDAILEKMISVFLYNKYPYKMEGFLTAARSATVRTESLSAISTKYGFHKYIKMSKGEESTGGRSNPSILEDVIESLIGALYLDGGPEAAQAFFDQFILPNANQTISEDKLKDPKSLFQEKVQAKGLTSPIYQTINATGPDHSKIFEVSVIVNDKPIATGTGKNKQEAEQQAAEKALSLINI
jgi:ribonuclease-3